MNESLMPPTALSPMRSCESGMSYGAGGAAAILAMMFLVIFGSLAAAMALACVSAEAAAPEGTKSFPVAITAGPLTMSIPSMLSNLP